MSFTETLVGWIDWGTKGGGVIIDKIHEESGMSWWSTLVMTAAGMRVVLFPFRMRGWLNGRLLKESTAHCNRVVGPQLRLKLKETPDAFKAQMLTEWRRIAVAVGASPWKSFTAIPVSVPLFLSIAGGIRRKFLDAAEENMSLLTEIVPIGALPVAVMNAIYLEISRRKAVKGKRWPFMIAHGVNLLSMGVLMQMPLAVDWFVFWSTAAALSESVWLEKSAFMAKFAQSEFSRRINKVEAQ